MYYLGKGKELKKEECKGGRAVRGQSYYVKEINMVDGKKMVRTIDDLYISGQPEHVKIEQM